jgi:hypothetical protein
MRTLIFLLLFSVVAKANTITAVNSGNWVLPQTWSCNCKPADGDTIVIPEGVTVNISRPLTVNTINIEISGTLDLSNGLLQMAEIGKITVKSGGKLIANGLGATITVGLITHVLETGTVIDGPAIIDTVMVPRRRRTTPAGS